MSLDAKARGDESTRIHGLDDGVLELKAMSQFGNNTGPNIEQGRLEAVHRTDSKVPNLLPSHLTLVST